jgi:hypothetical protein
MNSQVSAIPWQAERPWSAEWRRGDFVQKLFAAVAEAAPRTIRKATFLRDDP